jgi:hypothetical protein
MVQWMTYNITNKNYNNNNNNNNNDNNNNNYYNNNNYKMQKMIYILKKTF